MRVLFIGGPGAGKGTQSTRMAAFFGLTHLSSGDLLRRHVSEVTGLGQRVKAYMDRGDLAPDQIVMDMLRKPVLAASRTGGYILDGFPRTAEQAEAAAGGSTTMTGKSSSTGSRSTTPRPPHWWRTTPYGRN